MMMMMMLMLLMYVDDLQSGKIRRLRNDNLDLISSAPQLSFLSRNIIVILHDNVTYIIGFLLITLRSASGAGFRL